MDGAESVRGADVVLVDVLQDVYVGLGHLFFFQAEDGIRDLTVTGVQTCALPIYQRHAGLGARRGRLGIRQRLPPRGGPAGLVRRPRFPVTVTREYLIVRRNGEHWRSEERRVGEECRSRWSPDH